MLGTVKDVLDNYFIKPHQSINPSKNKYYENFKQQPIIRNIK